MRRGSAGPASTSGEPSPIRFGARAGLVANGLLHLVVAGLTVRVATGSTARTDQAGALQAVAAQPFGRGMVWLVAVCFAAVVLWRTREAVRGHSWHDASTRRRKRGFAALQAFVYAMLTGLAVRVAVSSSGGSGGQGPTAWLLVQPGGRMIVGLIGITIAVTGCVMGYRGWRLAFTEDMDLSGAAPAVCAAVRVSGRLGSVAKAVAMVIIGALVTNAGVHHDPARAEGLDAALKTVAAQQCGHLALLTVAAGLASFGVFSFLDARYHKV